MDMSHLTAQTIGMEKFSPSALDCYEQCPRLFYFQNWLGLKLEEDKLHLDFGNAIHSAIGMIFAQYDNNFGGSWEAADFKPVEADFRRQWTQKNVPDVSYDKFKTTAAGRDSSISSKEELYGSMLQDGIDMLKSYWDAKEVMLVEYGHDLVNFERYMKQTLFNPLNREEKLPIPMSYRIDAMTRKADKIVDFKTSKGKYDLVETRKKIQGQLYLLGHWCETGNFVGEFDYIVLRKGLKREDKIEVVRLVYDEADIVATFYRIQAILVRIGNREFSKPALGHASYCQCTKYESALDVK